MTARPAATARLARGPAEGSNPGSAAPVPSSRRGSEMSSSETAPMARATAASLSRSRRMSARNMPAASAMAPAMSSGPPTPGRPRISSSGRNGRSTSRPIFGPIRAKSALVFPAHVPSMPEPEREARPRPAAATREPAPTLRTPSRAAAPAATPAALTPSAAAAPAALTLSAACCFRRSAFSRRASRRSLIVVRTYLCHSKPSSRFRHPNMEPPIAGSRLAAPGAPAQPAADPARTAHERC